MEKLELIARGIIVHDGKILLCKNILGGGHYFLPGGHIEQGENPEDTLAREMEEEVGRKLTKVKHVAEVKNSYLRDGKQIDEIFYVYLVALDEYENIKSRESHLAFEWVPIDKLRSLNFKPTRVISDIVKNIEENKEFWD